MTSMKLYESIAVLLVVTSFAVWEVEGTNNSTVANNTQNANTTSVPLNTTTASPLNTTTSPLATTSSPTPNCQATENSCLEVVHHFEVCKRLHSWCPLIQDNNFTQTLQSHGKNYPWGTNQTCSQVNTTFCPLSFSCRQECTVDSQVSIVNRTTTPWGANCSASEGYCPLTGRCMPTGSKCSYKAFNDWKLAGNNSVTPSGQACPVNETFCPTSWSCQASSSPCKSVAVNGSDMNSLCTQNKTFNFGKLACDALNSSDPFPSFNLTGRTDGGSGYLAACRLQQTICARTLYAVQKCLPRVPKECLPNSDQNVGTATTTALPTTAPAANSTANSTIAPTANSTANSTIAPTANSTANSTRAPPANSTANSTTAPPTTALPCAKTEYRCNQGGNSSCIPNNATCGGKCKSDHFHCPTSKSCIPKGGSCPHEPVMKMSRKNCTEIQKSCAETTKASTVCKGVDKICTSLKANSTVFHKYTRIFEHYTLWGERCKGEDVFCPILMKCQPKNMSCSRDTVILSNTLSSTTPWGESCPKGKSFCPLAMACIPSNAPCSMKALADFVLCNASASGNSSACGNVTTPFGITCLSNTTFCHITLSCISKSQQCSFDLFNFTHPIKCNDGDKFCSKTARCIGGSSSCGTRKDYNLPKEIRGQHGGWVDMCTISDTVCPRLHYAAAKCMSHLPNSTVDECSKAHCPTGQCKATSMQVKQCFDLDKYCPGLANNSASLQTTLKTKNTYPSGDACSAGKRYCPLILGCIGVNHTCDINTVNDDKKPITPWGEACKFGQYYCPVFARCVEEKIHCGLGHIMKWSEGDKKKSPYNGDTCSGNQTYCIFSEKCHAPSQPCNADARIGEVPWSKMCPYGQKFCANSMMCVEPKTSCNNNSTAKLNETFGFKCGSGQKFCPNKLTCVESSANCSVALSNDPSGWATMCRYRGFGCQKILRTVQTCAKKCPFELDMAECPEGQKQCISSGGCIPKAETCCSLGSKFCKLSSSCIPAKDLCCRNNESFCFKTSSCIAKGSPCLGKEECIKGKFFCRELQMCLFDGESCKPKQPPPSKIQYKVVTPNITLDKGGNRTIFTSGTTIALMSLNSYGHAGELQVHRNGGWSAAGNLSESAALVVGKTDKLRFKYSEDGGQGAVLVNYTVMAGSVGAKVDASKQARKDDEVLVLIKFPELPNPKVVLSGVKYEILEDTKKDKGIEIEKLLSMEYKNSSKANNLPNSLLSFIPPWVTSYYYAKLNMAREAIIGMAIIQFSGAPLNAKEGVWEKLDNRTWKANTKRRSPADPFLFDPENKIRFTPYQNWNGNISFTVVAYQAVKVKPTDLGDAYYDLPASVQKTLSTVIERENVSSAVQDQLRKAGKALKSKKIRPNEGSLLKELRDLRTAAKTAKESTDIGRASDLIEQAYELASIVEGAAPGYKDEYEPVEGDKGGEKYIYSLPAKPVTFVGRVIAVNDQPEVTSFVAYFPPIAYNLTQNPNSGFLVSDVMSKPAKPFGQKTPSYAKPEPLAKDVEGAKLGMAVILARNTSIGSWYYKANGSVSWLKMVVDNVMTNGKPGSNASVFLLPFDARVKFEMHNPSIMWSNKEGSDKANIFFTAWDGSDGLSLGMHYLNFPVNKTDSLAKKIVKGFMTRLGCDGRPGSKGKVDICGRCGGDGKWCVGCDGVAKSGARVDHCGNCTGGTTNRTFNFRKDCGGGCGTSIKDKCGVCQKIGKERNFTDCSGKCFGKAKINKCGNCVGGTTGKAANFGEDLCGVCGGDSSSCKGCDGVANSGKVVDFCGTCLLPSDPSFNSACTDLRRLSPVSGPKSGGTKITVEGAGLQRFTTAKCKLSPSGGGAGVSMANANIQTNPVTKRKYFVVTSPVIAAAGAQNLSCTFDSDSKVYYVKENLFFAYDKTGFAFTSISPGNSEINGAAFNATITGSGFVNSGYLRCVADKFDVPAHYVSATQVECEFPTVPKSKELYIMVAFGEKDKAVVKAKAVRFEFWANSPAPKSVQFSNSLQSLIVTMNYDAKPVTKGDKNCASFFTNTTTFGTRAKCVMKTPWIMLIQLRGRPTIAPNDEVSFKNGSLVRKFEQVTRNSSGVHNLVVAQPSKTVTPLAKLTGAPFLGACAKLRLSASQSRGGGGRRLTFAWNVQWAADQNTGSLTSAETDDLAAIKKYLASLPSFSPRIKLANKTNLKFNAKYEFGVVVTNFLSQKSENSTLVVVRENKNLPSLSVGQKQRKIKASRDTVLHARVKLSPCLDPNAVSAAVLYSWEIDAVGVDIGATDKPKLRIKKGTLQGGKTYTVTVTATMASDQTLTVTETLKLQVESGPLVAVIRGGSYRVVGQKDTIKLDASRSKDPDNAEGEPWYQWECFDSSNTPCFEPDSANPGQEKRMVLDNKAIITIDVATRLKTKTLYKFVMTYNKGTRSATAETKIFVEAGSPPLVDIRPQRETKENPTAVVAVLGSVKSTIGNTNVSWSCVEETGYGFVDVSASGVVLSKVNGVLKKKAGQTTGSLGAALVFSQNALMENTKYKFRLTATHSDASAYTETEIVTNAPPSQGTLEVTPTNGTALDTKYTISAPEGWSDDADDFPLSYQFGFYKKKEGELADNFLNMPEENNIMEEVILPTGDKDNNNKLKMFVDVYDTRGAKTRAEFEITVNPKVISTSDLSGFTSSLGDSFSSGDVGGALGKMGAILDSFPEGDSSDPTVAAAMTEFKKSATSNTLNVVKNGGLTDADTKRQVTSTTAKSTKGGDKFDAATKKSISDTFLSMELDSSSSRRRRRAVSTPTVTAYTPAEAEAVLITLANLISVSDYTTDGMTQKSNYLSVAVSSGQKMCAGVVMGQPAAIAKTSMSVLSSVKDNFATVDTAYIDAACSDCPNNVKTPAKVLLGTALKGSYESWTCASDTTCNGACVVTTQLPHDLLVNATGNTSLTNTVNMQLYNPETYATLDPGTLASPYILRLPMEYNPNTTAFTENKTRTECKRWDSTANTWSTDGCVQTEKASLITVGNITYVECRCSKLGYISAFANDEELPTTAAPTTPTTVLPTTVAATLPPPVPVKMSFAIDYDATVNKHGKAAVENSIKAQIVTSLNVSANRISNLTISKGSIIVSFLLLPDPNSNTGSQAELNAQIAKLEQAVKSGNFSVKLPDGSVMTADPNSFVSGTVAPTTVAVQPTESSGLTETEIIIISVVCGVVALVILIVLVICCMKRKPSSTNKVSPRSSRANLADHGEEDVELAERGRDNSGYDNNNPNKSVRT